MEFCFSGQLFIFTIACTVKEEENTRLSSYINDLKNHLLNEAFYVRNIPKMNFPN